MRRTSTYLARPATLDPAACRLDCRHVLAAGLRVRRQSRRECARRAGSARGARPPPTVTPVSPFADMERGILAGINVYRGQGGTCGNESYDPSTPVTWDDGLAEAARVHMADHLANDLSANPHTGSDGSSVAERIRRASPQTAWLAAGENVALSSGTARDQLKDLWLTAWHASPVHCSNQLNPIFNRAGVSVGVKDGWYAAVVVFGQKAGG